jgi:hypothetical protein
VTKKKFPNLAIRYDTELRVDPNICCKEKEDEDLWLYQECAWKMPPGNFVKKDLKKWKNFSVLFAEHYWNNLVIHFSFIVDGWVK